MKNLTITLFEIKTTLFLSSQSYINVTYKIEVFIIDSKTISRKQMFSKHLELFLLWYVK